MIVTDILDLGELTTFARELPQAANLSLNRFLPDRVIPDIEGKITNTRKTNRAAKFRTWDAETPIGMRDTFSTDRVKLPPLGQKLVIGEYERLMLQRAQGATNGALVDSIYDDTANNVAAIRVRQELARGDVLLDGKFTLTGENGLTLDADFGLPNDHIESASTAWSDLSAGVFDDLMAWAEVYNTANGEMPGVILTSRRVLGYMLRNEEMRGLVANAVGGVSGIVTQGQLGQALSAYGLPQIETYDTIVDVDGSSVRVLPDDRVIFLPSDPRSLGETLWGITVEALELANTGMITLTDAPGIVATTMKTFDPVHIWTKASAVGMPVIYDPKRLFVADVAA